MAVKVRSSIPQYPNRAGNKSFMARKADYGDGGAYPEIHIAQFPLGVGRKIVDWQHRDLVPKIMRGEVMEIEETTLATKMALEKIVNVRLSANYVPKQSSDSKLIKYFNSGAKESVIRMVEMAVDPVGPPKFKHKRVRRASGSPPVPIMHSPPPPGPVVTVKDEQDWKIPPCISNWKNTKGYTIPLDKRVAPDGRGLQINDNFAALSEALYVADQKAREAVETRTELQKEMAMKEKERREDELRGLAEKARAERTGAEEEAKDASMRKKSKITRDGDRDVSEKVALGMGAGRGEVMVMYYDQRLFNQDIGKDAAEEEADPFGLDRFLDYLA